MGTKAHAKDRRAAHDSGKKEDCMPALSTAYICTVHAILSQLSAAAVA